MYLLTISYGSCAVDQRSGDGWISGWSQILVLCKRISNAKFWSTRCEDCFSTEQNHPYCQIQKKGQSGGTKSQKRDRFFRGRQIAYLIYEYFRVTGANDSVEKYADLFAIVLRNDDIQEFDSKWDGILLSMTKLPHDDILEGLYKLRIREPEKLETVLELYNMEIHQNKAGPDFNRLKTMVKRSQEQNLRIKNFEARNGNYERNAVVKNQGTKQSGQRTPGDCWQWKANGQCSKGDKCSFRHDINKRAKLTQPNPSPSSFMRQNERNASRTRSPRGKSPSGRMSRWPCKDYLKGTCTTSFCEKMASSRMLVLQFREWLQIWWKVLVMRTTRLKNSPAKRSKSNGDKSAVAMLKKGDWHERASVTDRDHDRSGRPDKRSDKKLRRNSLETSVIWYTTIGWRIPGHDAAEVYSPEEHWHAENDPACKVQEGYCASY